MVESEAKWQGVESMAEVHRLMCLGVPISTIAKQFGVSRPTLYSYIRKTKAASPGTDGGVTSPEGDSTANDTQVDSTSLTATEEVEQ